MKKMLLAVPPLLFLSGPALAQTIPARDAAAYYGRSVTVLGHARVQRMASGEIYLDMEGSGDGAPISAYVPRWRAAAFFDLARLDGKKVAVRGEIGSFRYRPEIYLTDPDQVAVVEPPVKVKRQPEPLWIHIPPR
jgi:hypothetical protein